MVDKVKGTIKEGAGKLTGDKRTEAEGQTDQAPRATSSTAPIRCRAIG